MLQQGGQAQVPGTPDMYIEVWVEKCSQKSQPVGDGLLPVDVESEFGSSLGDEACSGEAG